MNKVIIGLIIIFCLIIVLLILFKIMHSKKEKSYKKILDDLEYQKNQIATSKVAPELDKAKDYLNGKTFEMMYEDWQKRFNDIKEIKIPKITDLLINADYNLSKKDFKSTMYDIAKAQTEIYEAKTQSDFLLDEINKLTTSEERSRDEITKLKIKYRELLHTFNDTKSDYGYVAPSMELQFENISKRFEDFEKAMEESKYDEAETITGAINEMLRHMSVLIEEVPNVVLLTSSILPNKIKEIKSIYKKMTDEGYPLDYLNVEFNIDEANKKINDIKDRAKLLDIENSLFDLKVLTEYFENLFNDFEKEKIIRKEYNEASKSLNNKLRKTNTLVNDIFNQLDELKSTYDLKEEDINELNQIKKDTSNLNEDFRILNEHTLNHTFPYSKLLEEIGNLSLRMNKIEENLDVILDKLGTMHDDEERARQQLGEVNALLKDAKSQIRSYNLPVIPNSYYVELKEASEAIHEIVKELSKKPVKIDVLNTRVDTARDLAIKLFSKTKQMIKTARFTEMAMVYANRYRSTEPNLDRDLTYAERLFKKGEYDKALELTINSLNKVEPGIYDKLVNLYKTKENTN